MCNVSRRNNFSWKMLLLGIFLPVISIQSVYAQPLYPPAIKGIVTDENQNPVEGAKVIVLNYDNPSEIISSYFTNYDGSFKLESLPFNIEKYLLWIDPKLSNLSGYPPQYWDQNTNSLEPPQRPIQLYDYTIFSVQIKLSTNPPDISEPPDTYFAAIEGQLNNESGVEFPNVKVAALEPQSLTPVDSTMSNQYGGFVLFNIPPDCPHILAFIPPTNTGYPPQFYAQTGMTSANPSHTIIGQEFNTLHVASIQLSQNPDTVNDTTSDATVRITLLDSLNNPVYTNGYLSLSSDQGPSFGINMYADSIVYPVVFHSVPQGNYVVFIECDTYPEQYYYPGGNTINPFYYFNVFEYDTLDFNISLTDNPTDTNARPNISGSVKNSSGTPISNANVYALDLFNSSWDPWINASDIQAPYTACTDGNGCYKLYNVQPGEYALIAQKDIENYVTVFYRDALWLNDAEMISIQNPSDSRNADFFLRPGTTVSGFVKIGQNKGVENIRVNLWRDHESGSFSTFYYETNMDADGKFVFRGIPEGMWHAEIMDENGIYYRADNNYEEIVTSQGNPFVQLQKEIIIKAGGLLHGKYTLPGSDTIYHHDLGIVFLYPEDTSIINDSLNYQWEYMHIQLMTTDTPGVYRTSPIPEGNWRMVISPNPMYDMMTFPPEDYKPYLKWAYIDNASSIENTKIFTIAPHQLKEYEIRFDEGGYILRGYINSDSSDLLGFDTLTGEQGKPFTVQAYIKENDHYIKIAESNWGNNNTFIIPGLIDGEQYYLRTWAENYPDQWWISPDSSTCKRENASPYTFSTSNFIPLRIFLMAKPEGWNDWSDEGPSALKNITIKPVAFSAFLLKWDRSPQTDKVVSYKIFRITNPREDMFYVNNDNYWEPYDMDSIMALIDSFIVSDTFFVDTGVDYNATYMYAVAAIDIEGHEGHIELSGNKPITSFFHKISYSAFNIQTEVKPESWHMVGICGLDSLKPQSAEKTTIEVLEMYQWDETADSTKLYSHYVPINSLYPTQGAWIYSSEIIPLLMTESSFDILETKKDAITVSLNKGWSQISSPFPYKVSPSWLMQDHVAWEWVSEENKYVEATALKPWKAYWVESDETKTLPVPPKYSTAMTRGVLSKLSRNAQWELTISLIGENSSDPDNFIGTLPADQLKSLKNTSLEPPPAFDFPHLYFVNGSEKLSKHYVFSSVIPTNKLEWKAGISPSDEAMSITVNGIATIPEELSLFWVDNSGIINLRKNNTVSISAHSETTYGYIVATTNPDDIGLYSGKLVLSPNFPNPFRGYTTIEFHIPYFWGKDGSSTNSDRQKVSLNIYNLAGQLVSTVFSGNAKAGHHRKVWNGKSNSGRTAPSGIYIARLKIGDHTKTMRMFKVR